jgi:tetratricopeptide (TPR) repeat protein
MLIGEVQIKDAAASAMQEPRTGSIDSTIRYERSSPHVWGWSARWGEVALTLGNLANVLADLGELPAARERLERALHLLEAAYGPDHPDLALTLGNLGDVLADLGELPAARERLERAVGIYRRTLGTEHPHAQWAQRLLDDLP